MATRYVNTASSAGGDGTTNATTGANRAYASLSEWEAARQAVLSEVEECLCEGTAADTTIVAVDGWTTTATNYIHIKGNTGSSAGKHPGNWSTSHYRLQLGAYGAVLTLTEAHVRVSGIQIYQTTNADAYWGLTCVDDTGVYRLDGLLVRGPNGTGYTNRGVTLRGDAKIWNSVAWDWMGGSTTGFTQLNAGAKYAYNCTAYNCQQGFQNPDNGTNLLVYNCLADACVNGFNAGWTWGASDYNASSLASDAPGSNSRNSQTFTFENTGAGDFHLTVDDAGAKDYGVSDPGSGLYSDDIDGDTRSGSWDIGADEYVAAGGGTSITSVVGAATLTGGSPMMDFGVFVPTEI